MGRNSDHPKNNSKVHGQHFDLKFFLLFFVFLFGSVPTEIPAVYPILASVVYFAQFFLYVERWGVTLFQFVSAWISLMNEFVFFFFWFLK